MSADMNSDAVSRYFELRKRQMEIEQQLEALKPTVAARLRQQEGVARAPRRAGNGG